jgi:hypothetical protein
MVPCLGNYQSLSRKFSQKILSFETFLNCWLFYSRIVEFFPLLQDNSGSLKEITWLKQLKNNCKLRGTGFSTHGNLNSPTLTNSDKKPFVCSICGEGFCTNLQLKLTHLYRVKDLLFAVYVVNIFLKKEIWEHIFYSHWSAASIYMFCLWWRIHL